ncbi:CLUMA_CG012976, isoform A [Clunio marinus]|uniref:CLUMA_CG012976, isoform A n=1 Tax=Clunio marinus TaxID=568069 RepID=A0A1J1IHN7_9DIPT|nr:CLUMA_CG012976, isoform A [Clunio marinus]
MFPRQCRDLCEVFLDSMEIRRLPESNLVNYKKQKIPESLKILTGKHMEWKHCTDDDRDSIFEFSNAYVAKKPDGILILAYEIEDDLKYLTFNDSISDISTENCFYSFN